MYKVLLFVLFLSNVSLAQELPVYDIYKMLDYAQKNPANIFDELLTVNKQVGSRPYIIDNRDEQLTLDVIDAYSNIRMSRIKINKNIQKSLCYSDWFRILSNQHPKLDLTDFINERTLIKREVQEELEDIVEIKTVLHNLTGLGHDFNTTSLMKTESEIFLSKKCLDDMTLREEVIRIREHVRNRKKTRLTHFKIQGQYQFYLVDRSYKRIHRLLNHLEAQNITYIASKSNLDELKKTRAPFVNHVSTAINDYFEKRAHIEASIELFNLEIAKLENLI